MQASSLRAPSFFHIFIGQFADVAQWLEQGFHKAKVAGSNPAVGTKIKKWAARAKCGAALGASGVDQADCRRAAG
jgi:hypothetical protein